MHSIESRPPHWEIFCRVVDNFGDIGVSWRLARDLAARTGERVRLWVDDWNALEKLCPQAAGGGKEQSLPATIVDGVELWRWSDPFPAVEPAAVVIEAFACELPQAHVQAMAGRQPVPQWINLEYLTAEPWIDRCHGLASPHPRLALVKHFFFPGFSARSGGLLREQDLFERRDTFISDPAGRQSWRESHGIRGARDSLCISLFSYEQPGLDDLFALWRQSSTPVVVLVPEGRVLADVRRALGRPGLAAGMRVEDGSLAVEVLPFCALDDYDRLLWSCDLNFVRGEDSLVRGQWAARPLVWQAYPQEDGAHFDKLDAFMALYFGALAPEQAALARRFWLAWNGKGVLVESWPAFAGLLPQLQAQAAAWAAQRGAEEDLVSRLCQFCSQAPPTRGRMQG